MRCGKAFPGCGFVSMALSVSSQPRQFGLSFAPWPLCDRSRHSERAGAANGVAGTGQDTWSQTAGGRETSWGQRAHGWSQGLELGLCLHPTQHTLVFAEVPRRWLRLPAAGSDGCAGADRPAGMLSPREALAGGSAFLGIVLLIVRAASVRRADEIRARCSALGQRSRCRAADGAISGTRFLSVLPSLREQRARHSRGDLALLGEGSEEGARCLCPPANHGRAAEVISEKKPQPSSLSLSFLSLYQSIPVSSPAEVSTPVLSALPHACSFAGRTQVPLIPNSIEYQSSACKSTERKGLGGSSPLQSLAVAELRGAKLPHEKSTIFLLLLRRIPPSTHSGF